MSFFRKEVIDFALDHETEKHIAEQRQWIAAHPANPQPYVNLARLYRMQGRKDAALGLLLEAVRLDQGCKEAHIALAEAYAVEADYAAARRHAHAAAAAGDDGALALLRRHGIAE